MKKTVVRSILIVSLTLAVVYLFTREISEVMFLREENEKIEKKIEELEFANKELEGKIKAIKSDKRYIEKIAREELGMIKEGDKVYRFAE
ncbi:MAG: septum formation initiator family protein [Deltaproteobacteria bacterium]|nr:septum formation initiator family protein [Deltaproteobacteria bacterium]